MKRQITLGPMGVSPGFAEQIFRCRSPTVRHHRDVRPPPRPSPLESPAPCPPGADGTAGDTDTLNRSWEPQPDGTLRGVLTDTVVAVNCGDQGSVYKTPMVITREGDVPDGVTVADQQLFADPALFKNPTATPMDCRH